MPMYLLYGLHESLPHVRLNRGCLFEGRQLNTLILEEILDGKGAAHLLDGFLVLF
jgi:hypothetical protein